MSEKKMIRFAVLGALENAGSDEWWAAAQAFTSVTMSPAGIFRREGIPYDPKKWLGRSLSESERQRYSRAVSALEAAGEITRAQTGPRTFYIRPTLAGVKAALTAAGKSADRQKIGRGIERAEWAGQDLRRFAKTLQS